MKLTAVGKYHSSSDIRIFKNIPPPIFFIAYSTILRTSACVCGTSENCKSLVLQGKCNIEIFLSPERVLSSTHNICYFPNQKNNF